MIRTAIDRVLLSTPGAMSRHYRGYKWWRWGERELHLLPALCDRRRTSVDVGANRGMYTYFMGKLSHHCLAFEPNPALIGDLRKQIRNTTLYEFALSDHSYATELRIPKREGRAYTGSATIEVMNEISGEFDVRMIEARTLDSFAFENVGFIKVDTEGHELAFLRGAARTLETCKPRLLIEAEERHRAQAVASVSEFLAPLGYSGFFLWNGSLVSVARFDRQRHQRVVSAGPEYVSNFLFLHKKDDECLHRSRAVATRFFQ